MTSPTDYPPGWIPKGAPAKTADPAPTEPEAAAPAGIDHAAAVAAFVKVGGDPSNVTALDVFLRGVAAYEASDGGK